LFFPNKHMVRPGTRNLLLALALAVAGTGCRVGPGAARAPRSVAADSVLIGFTDFESMEVLPDHSVRFQRNFEPFEPAYRWDNPGARIRFRTNASLVQVRLRYNEKHASRTARQPVGIYSIDGRREPDWTFTSSSTEIRRAVEEVVVTMPPGRARGFHDFDIVMPYGDSVDFCGLTLNADAKLVAPSMRKRLRYVAYGDSITQGFTATHIGKTYAFQLAAALDGELINLAIAGRRTHAEDGEVIGRQHADLITVLMGGNDWQGGIEPESYQREMRGLLTAIRRQQPQVPIYLITPLWVSPQWRPPQARYDLETYRRRLRQLVDELADPAIKLIEGPALIDHSEVNFDPVLVHPNDRGFDQMAARLRQVIRP
jgi:lysophospholipase L1-like esterase